MISRLRRFQFAGTKPPDRLAVELLESRQLLSANIKLNPLTGVVTISGSSVGDQAYVDAVDPATLRVSLNAIEVERFSLNAVARIDFLGRAGDDLFLNRSTIPSIARGGEGNDQLTGGYAPNQLFGDGGNDELVGRAGADLIYGGTANDKIWGGSGSDQLFGSYGNDVLYGGSGNDFLYGHCQNDTLLGESGSDTIRGSEGNDYILGGDQDDWLYGDEGIDTIEGGIGNDTASGGAQDDIVNGGSGNDKIRGDLGDDRLNGSTGSDWVWGNDGADEILGWHGPDALFGGRGDDLIRGGIGRDVLSGDDGSDRLLGEWDADKIRGGIGDDRIIGGEASVGDVLYGDAGRDRFLVEGPDVVVDGSNIDAKLTFSRGDKNWSPTEIEVFDEGFQVLYQQTHNNVLLRDSLDADGITLVKYSSLPGGALSINRLRTVTVNGRTTYTRVIEVRDWSESDPQYNNYLVSTVVHEMGHNWDSVKEIGAVAPASAGIWNAFLKLSGWTQSQPSNLALYSRSTDGQWWYLKSAEFARSYGCANPYEDWSTVWERYAFPQTQVAGRVLQQKLAAVRSLFTGLSKLA